MIIVNFPEDERVITTEPVYQWDYGRQLKITGLDGTLITEVHFCNRNCIEAKVRLGTVVDDGVVVTIPDDLLSDPYNINVFIYACSGTSGKTNRQLQIPMLARKKPESFVETLTPTEEAMLTEAMNNINAELDAVNAIFEESWSYDELVAFIESKHNIPMNQGTMSLTANGWSGTKVPNVGGIGKLYFNTNLNKEEVDAIVNGLTLDGDFYYVCGSSDSLAFGKFILNISKLESNGTYWFIITLSSQKGSWTIFDGGQWYLGSFSLYEKVDISQCGLQNDLISSLISITPFEASYNAVLSDDKVSTEGQFIEIYSTDYEISNGLKSKNITIESGKVNIVFTSNTKFDLTEIPVIYRIGNNDDNQSWCYFYF